MNEIIKNAGEMRPVRPEHSGLRPAPKDPQAAAQDAQAAAQDARAALAAAEAALADKTARAALADRIDADCELAGATITLLTEVARLRVHGLAPLGSSVRLAKYRKELSALAESYGVRIVLVGDKTAAMLVLA